MTGKKTDNKDCAIKNPDKWGAEKSEKENNSRIERSVKDDNPAQAGFFYLPIRDWKRRSETSHVNSTRR